MRARILGDFKQTFTRNRAAIDNDQGLVDCTVVAVLSNVGTVHCPVFAEQHEGFLRSGSTVSRHNIVRFLRHQMTDRPLPSEMTTTNEKHSYFDANTLYDDDDDDDDETVSNTWNHDNDTDYTTIIYPNESRVLHRQSSTLFSSSIYDETTDDPLSPESGTKITLIGAKIFFFDTHADDGVAAEMALPSWSDPRRVSFNNSQLSTTTAVILLLIVVINKKNVFQTNSKTWLKSESVEQ